MPLAPCLLLHSLYCSFLFFLPFYLRHIARRTFGVLYLSRSSSILAYLDVHLEAHSMEKEIRLAISQTKSSAFIVVNSMNCACSTIHTMLPEICPSSMSWRQCSQTEPVGYCTQMKKTVKGLSRHKRDRIRTWTPLFENKRLLFRDSCQWHERCP